MNLEGLHVDKHRSVSLTQSDDHNVGTHSTLHGEGLLCMGAVPFNVSGGSRLVSGPPE